MVGRELFLSNLKNYFLIKYILHPKLRHSMSFRHVYHNYTCRIAVRIPKTAIGVTAILPTAISVTAMAAKNYVFLDHFL